MDSGIDWDEFYSNAIRIGLSEGEIDLLTFKEVSRRIIIFNEKQEEKQLNDINLQIIGAYYTEVMHRQDKRLPKIDKFLIKTLKRREKVENEAMLEQVKV